VKGEEKRGKGGEEIRVRKIEEEAESQKDEKNTAEEAHMDIYARP
jgi:hypothetical protein